ncbi:MAG TPA: alpha-L-arabinofuranosidase C-terminal domain-containing protein [Candidatus Bathyarchaeia archaeon]|nr:alpha-L-arabinofuranosidase C-terminal domain-containing protein [Candidatus Bathyarchaeia archaeon]
MRVRKTFWIAAGASLLAFLSPFSLEQRGLAKSAWAGAASASLDLKVYAEPSHDGRIDPMLYGGFVELLDDVVPGMWAEMLGDRGFEGVLPTSTWDYFRGEPNLCDRDWDKGPGWTYDTAAPFNDRQCARLDVPKGGTARLTQGQLAVRKGAAYLFTGYVRGEAGAGDVRITLRTLLPDETWTVLAAAPAGRPDGTWRKVRVRLVSAGTTDRAVLEIAAAGGGRVWLDQLSLMPEDNVDGWRRDVVEAMKEMAPPVVRWGGSTIDPGPYRWAETVGDRDRRPSFVNRVWGRRDTNDVGVEEFVRLCRAAGAEPLVCVSLGDGLENARRMVEYLNGAASTDWGKKRAANGRPEPYGVKYWQVGNEIDAPGYAKSLVEFARAVKAVDPGAVVLSSFPTKEIVDAAGADIDIVCPHYYQSDLEGVDADLRAIEDWIRQSPGRDRLRIGVTEWNINAGNWGLGRGKLNTLGCALFEARFLNVLHRHAGLVTLACRSNMTNSFCGGTIQTNAAGLYRTPSFHVMAMYRAHARPVPLRVTGDLPVALDVTACASDDRTRATIFIVNPGRDAARVSLDLSDFGPGFAVRGGEIVKDAQDRGQIDIVNGFADPNRVVRVKLETGRGTELTLPGLSIAAIDCGRKDEEERP